jgi:hypothetical protein
MSTVQPAPVPLTGEMMARSRVCLAQQDDFFGVLRMEGISPVDGVVPTVELVLRYFHRFEWVWGAQKLINLPESLGPDRWHISGHQVVKDYLLAFAWHHARTSPRGDSQERVRGSLLVRRLAIGFALAWELHGPLPELIPPPPLSSRFRRACQSLKELFS